MSRVSERRAALAPPRLAALARSGARLGALWLLAGACGGAGEMAFPPAVVPPRPSASEWPDVGAIVLEDVAQLDYRAAQREDGQVRLLAVLEHRRRVKILNASGLEHAEVRLPIDAFSTVSEVRARSVSASGDVEGMPLGALRAVAMNVAGRGAPELKELVFTVPGAQVGGVLDYAYTRVYTAPEHVPIWVFGGPQPTVRAELSILHDEGIKVDYRYGVGPQAREITPLRRRASDGRDRLVFVERDLPAFYPEPQMPHLSRVAPWVVSVLTAARVGGKLKVRLETWRDIAVHVIDMFEKVGGKGGSGSPESRFTRIRDELLGLELPGLGVRDPVDAVSLLDGAPACTRDAAAVLLRALEGSDAKFYPALLTAPSGPVALEGLPGLYPFVRAVVAVDVSEQAARDPSCKEDPISRGLLCSVPDNSYAFLDPLCAHCRFGELPTELTGGRALVILPKGPEWVDVPEDPPERNRAMTQYRLQMDVDGTMRGKMNGEVTGSPARSLRSTVDENQATDEARDAAVTALLLGPEAKPKLREATLTPLGKPDKPLRVQGKVDVRLEKLGYEDFRINPIDVVGPALPGRWRSARRYPAVLDAPAWIETVAAIDLPVGYQVEDQEVVKIVTPFAEYAAGFARRDRVLNFSRRLVLKKHVIGAEEWREFRAFLEEIEAVEQKGVRAWLVR